MLIAGIPFIYFRVMKLNVNMFRIKYTIILLLLFFGCQRQNSSTILEDFKNVNTEYVQSLDIELQNDTVLWNPLDITVFDSLAIFYDETKSTCFTIINLKNGQLIKRFGFSGRGPGEMDISAVYLRRSQQKNIFILYEANAPYRLFKYYLDSLLINEVYKPVAYYILPSNCYFNDANLINDSIVIGSYGGYNNAIYGILNCKNQLFKIRNKIIFPTDNLEYSVSDYTHWLLNVLNGKSVLNPSKNKICYFSYKGLLIDISSFNLYNYNLSSIYTKNDYFPAFKIDNRAYTQSPILTSDCRMGFNDVAATKSKILALYNGQQIVKGKNQFLFSNTILVYDWFGNPIKIIKLDKSYSHISMDPENPNVMYGLHAYDSVYISKFYLNE